MKPLYTQEQFDSAKSTDKLPCECYQCGGMFYAQRNNLLRVIKKSTPNDCRFCSHTCTTIFNRNSPPLEVDCSNCQSKFMKKQSDIKKSKSGNHFCSKSCSASYNNKNKTTGTRRSKLESYIEEQLTILYPEFEINFNRKDAIGSELDIYIPSLNIAFELNGIFHYEPIYGVDKLNQIQNNDTNKFKLCIENKIDLCIIDTSGQSYFKIYTSQKYLDIITNIINKRI